MGAHNNTTKADWLAALLIGFAIASDSAASILAAMNGIGFVSTLTAILLTGCASVRNASRDDEAAAQKFLPRPNTASLFLSRDDPGEAAKGTIHVFVSLGGRFEITKCAEEVVQLGPYSFARVEVPEGSHELICFFFSKKDGFGRIVHLPIEVTKGQLYFVTVNPYHGLSRNDDQEAAKKTVFGCRMGQSETLDMRGTFFLSRMPDMSKFTNLSWSVTELRLIDAKGNWHLFYLQTRP